MRPSRRFHLVLPAQLEAGIRSFATRHGLSLAEAVRSLSERSLAAGTTGITGIMRESPATLAALVAAEHVVLMVASVLPEGEERARELAPQAAAAAEERLAMFREVEL